jgi:hypothetical protein
METQFKTFKEFYPYYLQEHRNSTCKIFHFIGTSLVILTVIAAIVLQSGRLALAVPFVGYGFAWIGHFFFEKNRPATFIYPGKSLLADFVLFKDLLTGRIQFFDKTNTIQQK